MNIANERFLPAGAFRSESPGQVQTARSFGMGNVAGSFGDILEKVQGQSQKAGAIKFSKHATDRLATRDITLDDEQLDRLQDGIIRAGMKGIRESLMIMDRLAFIVNVPSGTVVTAMDSELSNEQVFTNIDGAVIV